jgi:hypothetical protein
MPQEEKPALSFLEVDSNPLTISNRSHLDEQEESSVGSYRPKTLSDNYEIGRSGAKALTYREGPTNLDLPPKGKKMVRKTKSSNVHAAISG